MPKYLDLHCHIDGSLDVKTSYKLAMERNIISSDMSYKDYKKAFIVPKNNADLYEFLRHFELAQAVMQDEKAIRQSIDGVVKNLKKDNVIYAELRFAPQFHLDKGLTQEEVVAIFVDETKKASEKYGVMLNLILCMMISGTYLDNYYFNKETVELAKKYLNKGVVAIDLAGGEDIVKISEYKELFDYCKKLRVPFIIHAGEAGTSENVKTAVKLGAKRIGHGGHALQDDKVVEMLVKKQIPLEMCVTSNVQCHNQESYAKHAFKPLLKKGVNVTINTDNRALSDTTITKEVKLIQKHMGISDKQINKIFYNMIDASFATKKQKEELKRIYKEK